MSAFKGANELLPGAFQIFLLSYPDNRGCLVKTPLPAALKEIGINFEPRDEFYSISAKAVIRGMHYQRPPHHHEKFVYCPSGAVLDVLLDLRPGSGYAAISSLVLTSDKPSVLYIPSGVAHGFKSLKDDSVLVYKTSTVHVPSHDSGILYNSIDFDWDCPNPVISDRDRSHPPLAEVDSPFCVQ